MNERMGYSEFWKKRIKEDIFDVAAYPFMLSNLVTYKGKRAIDTGTGILLFEACEYCGRNNPQIGAPVCGCCGAQIK